MKILLMLPQNNPTSKQQKWLMKSSNFCKKGSANNQKVLWINVSNYYKVKMPNKC